MNSLVVTLIGVTWLIVAYRVYSRIIDRKVIQPDDHNQTPALRLQDGVDFYPAKPLVLFGHHFASIAGAGPIIGPVIAVAAFGYAASLVWILLGVVLVGAVHDYTTLMVSVRHDGKSISEITTSVIGKQARWFFQIFVLITLIFVIAVFAIAATKTFVDEPRIVIPAFGLIPLAMLFGWLTNRIGLPLWLSTLVALAALAGLFFLGMQVEVKLPFNHQVSKQIWIVVLLLYGLGAAVLPVWLLLQPRDYIAYWILVVGMLAGFSGLLMNSKPITAPVITDLVSPSQGPIWPMLFILIACGAVSGFHSLVASGTTAKQLAKESHGRPVAFGAMITEGGLALLALLSVACGLSYDAASGPSLLGFLRPGGGGPIMAFATGFGEFTKPFLGSLGALFGMTMLNAFVLTTLDTSVRLGRFITSELFADSFKPSGNRIIATAFVVVCAWSLAASGSETSLWPLFGAANQLVAALAMIVVSAYLARLKRPRIYTLGPALFMLATTGAALVWKGYQYWVQGQVPLTLTALILLLLAAFVSHTALVGKASIHAEK